MTATDSEGPVEVTVGFTDLSGNSGLPASGTTDGQRVVIDVTAPTTGPSVTIRSDGSDGLSSASVGDTIILELTVSEPLSELPVVVIAGQRADFVSGSGLTFSATRVVVDSDVSGVARHTASFVDLAGNHGMASGTTTDGSAVTMATATSVDSTAPYLISVTVSTDNVNPSRATAGDTITVVAVASEPLHGATASIAGRAAAMAGADDGVAGSAGSHWTASIVVRGSDTQGTVALSIECSDVAGNSGTRVDTTTDGSLAVRYGRTFVDSRVPEL